MKKLFYKVKLFFVGLFYGMKSADITLLHQNDNDSDNENIDHHLEIDNVMSDFLNEQETQRVIETRDAYYRLLFEADKYSVSMEFDENGELKSAKAKRNNGKWITPPSDVVDMSDGLKVIVIQENEYIMKEGNLIVDPNSITSSLMGEIYKDLESKNPNDYLTLIELDYGKETPRYRLDKYIKKIVVKNDEKSTSDCAVEFYVSKYQEQFNKVHALFLSELDRIKNNDIYKSDIFDIERIGFITNGRAWGSSPAAVFSFKDIKYNGIHEFDGNYILSFVCTPIKLGENVGEKYKTKELDEKYAKKAQKNKLIDINAVVIPKEPIDNNNES